MFSTQSKACHLERTREGSGLELQARSLAEYRSG
jgi:hypothetical protein